jgi:hypothetical protein
MEFIALGSVHRNLSDKSEPTSALEFTSAASYTGDALDFPRTPDGANGFFCASSDCVRRSPGPRRSGDHSDDAARSRIQRKGHCQFRASQLPPRAEECFSSRASYRVAHETSDKKDELGQTH